MKYVLVAIIFTQATVDHGASIWRHIGSYPSLEECESSRDLMQALYAESSTWMAPNADPQTIASVSYACLQETD